MRMAIILIIKSVVLICLPALNAELADLEESAQLMQEDGFAVEFLSQDPLARNYHGALFNAGDGGIHPAKFVSALQAASGLKALEGEPVLQVVKDGRQGILVKQARAASVARKY